MFYTSAIFLNTFSPKKKMSTSKKVALLGCTGKVGGWVLEMALERGFSVRALARKAEKLEAYKEKIDIVEGGVNDESKLRELLSGVDVVISTLGSPSNDNVIMKAAAESLVKVLNDMDNPPRYRLGIAIKIKYMCNYIYNGYYYLLK